MTVGPCVLNVAGTVGVNEAKGCDGHQVAQPFSNDAQSIAPTAWMAVLFAVMRVGFMAISARLGQSSDQSRDWGRAESPDARWLVDAASGQ